MIYGQDEPMLFPVADLYDSGMMQMYINAAKEQYNQNREDMKEFMKTYGDFMSPFANDIAWVDQQTRGRINDAMRYMQENGIDPLRSAEGRAIIQNVINTTDRAGINTRKANAALGEEYLKARGQLAAKGLYNSEYENWILKQMGLPDFEHFDSSMGVWTRTSPAEFSDLNKATTDWFDLEDSDLGLDPTGKFRMTGVTRGMMQEALTPHLPGFVSGDLGGFFLEKARESVKREHPELSGEALDAEAMKELQENILTANRERVKVKYTQDPYAMKAVEQNYDLQKAAVQHKYALQQIAARGAQDRLTKQYEYDHNPASKGSKDSDYNSYSYSLFMAGLKNYSGTPTPGRDALQSVIKFGTNVMKSSWNDKVNSYKDRFMMKRVEDPGIFASRFQEADVADNGTITFTSGSKKYHANRIYTFEDVMSHTLGYRGKAHQTSQTFRDNINDIRTTGNVYTAPMKNGSNEQYVEVIVNDGTSARFGYYKIFQSEPIPVKMKDNSTFIPGTAGYTVTPTEGEAVRIATIDSAINEAIGLASSGTKNSVGQQLELANQ